MAGSQKRKSTASTPTQLRTPTATLTLAEDPAPAPRKRIKKERPASPTEAKDAKSKMEVVRYVSPRLVSGMETYQSSRLSLG